MTALRIPIWFLVCVFMLHLTVKVQAHDQGKGGSAHHAGDQTPPQQKGPPNQTKPAMRHEENQQPMEPAEVVRRYLTAVYARDYATAYTLISQEDRQVKTQEEYVQENGAFAGAVLEITRTLAALIEFEALDTEIAADQATVRVTARLPNANAPPIHTLAREFDEDRLAALSPAERQSIGDQIGELARAGKLPTLLAQAEKWELVREEGNWRVLLNWAGAVLVRFAAFTHADLQWEFSPVQPLVRALPGETLRTFYRVKSLATEPTTGKARHVLSPVGEPAPIEIVSCFCFLQQTLDPGEAQQLPVHFRVHHEIPASIQELQVRYEFYPIERFPEQERQ